MYDYEKLGQFYLGRAYDLERQSLLDDLVMYDSPDLTTHGLCVGMTGSGKTGLSICLLEEAAIDGVPALCIDPKGDLGNLLLTFPELRPEDFRPWIDEAEAARRSLDPDQAAAATADRWRAGLAQWGQEPSRIARLREAAQFSIYTPGSTAGRPISVLGSLQAPGDLQDTELMREAIQSTVSGLLGLLGIDADPLRSQEHILLSNIIEVAWLGGRDMSLAQLIQDILEPPFTKIGVMDLDSVYPEKGRRDLAVRLNSLLASPGFSAWLEGEPLDVGRLLYTADGRPRIAILSIAHLSDAERMFFVTLLLNQVVAWMRKQSGTPSLRALLYMDEIFGYFPPTAMPPCKRPMLTLLKQARAYGLGILLATQNPVDLDYKGLANTGTWLIGRLQTERDKARVLDGLEGAATSAGGQFDRSRMDSVLSGLGSRVFLMHNVHETAPVVFQTRWAMSYLSGPLTRDQIRRLSDLDPEAAQAAARPAQAALPMQEPLPAPAVVPAPTAEPQPQAPPPEVPRFYLPPAGAPPADATVEYRPALAAIARVPYRRADPGVDHLEELLWIVRPPEPGRPAEWDKAVIVPEADMPLELEPVYDAAQFAPVDLSALDERSLKNHGRALMDFIQKSVPLRLWRCPALKGVSEPGETEAQFRVRMGQAAREQRDETVSRLRAKYSERLAAVQRRIEQAEARVIRERSEHGEQRLQTAVTVGSTLVGALLGRKVVSRRNVESAASAMRRAGRSQRTGQELAQAQAALEREQAKLAELEAEFSAAMAPTGRAADPAHLELEVVEIRARKVDMNVEVLGVLWGPWAIDPSKVARELFHVPASARRVGL